MRFKALLGIIFCSVFIFFSCATSPVAQTIIEPAPVVSVASSEKLISENTPVMVEETIYKIVSEEIRYPDGLLSGSAKNTWDAVGREIVQELFDGKGRLVSRSTFNQVSQSEVEIIQTSGTGEFVSKTLRSLVDSRIVSDVQMKLSGEVLSREDTEYDSEGKKIRFEVQSASGNTISTDYVHSNGQLSEIIVRDIAGQQIKRFVLIYNNEGILEKEEEFDLKDRLSTGIVYINENGFLIKEIKKNVSGGIISSVEYKNDAYGNPVETRYFDRRGRLKEVKTTVWRPFTRLVPQK